MLLSISFLIIGVIWMTNQIMNHFTEEEQKNTADIHEEILQEKETKVPAVEEKEDEQKTEIKVPETETPEEEQETYTDPVIYTADRSYFDDALFIGDSRTVGLYQYGDLGNALVLADTGMSVYKLAGKELHLSDGSKTTFEALLTDRKFQKIYLMLGINELGYDIDQTVRRYAQIVDRIQELQPQAVLFIQANLHITAGKSEASDIYNNENINRLNKSMKEIAEERNLMYLDVNPLFDDAEGNLSPEYTVDESHVLGKYYKDWVEWILSNAVEIEAAEEGPEQN